ncbi:MAG: helix-turn-helix-type transcriptional regulator, partial [Bacteroidota bacterium]
YQIHQPEFIYAIISETFTKPPVRDYVETLTTTFPETQILLSGHQVISQKVASTKNCRVLPNLAETVAFLDQLRQK